jgi:hypothetical protein
MISHKKQARKCLPALHTLMCSRGEFSLVLAFVVVFREGFVAGSHHNFTALGCGELISRMGL